MKDEIAKVIANTLDFHLNYAHIGYEIDLDGIATEIAVKLLPIVGEKDFPCTDLLDHMADDQWEDAPLWADYAAIDKNGKPDYFEFFPTFFPDYAVSIERRPKWSSTSTFCTQRTRRASKATEKKPTPKVAPPPRPKAKRETTPEEMDLVYQVVTYLNEKTEQQFQPGGEKTKTLILARHHGDKWMIEDFKTVIDHKKSEWFAKDNLRQYLRPSTLFAAGHAEEYLQAAKLWKKKPVATSGIVPLYRQENYQNVDKSKFKF